MPSVFEKLDDAEKNGKGVELTCSEVWLLMELAGETIAKASDNYEQWRERFKEHEQMKHRDGPTHDGRSGT